MRFEKIRGLATAALLLALVAGPVQAGGGASKVLIANKEGKPVPVAVQGPVSGTVEVANPVQVAGPVQVGNLPAVQDVNIVGGGSAPPVTRGMPVNLSMVGSNFGSVGSTSKSIDPIDALLVTAQSADLSKECSISGHLGSVTLFQLLLTSRIELLTLPHPVRLDRVGAVCFGLAPGESYSLSVTVAGL